MKNKIIFKIILLIFTFILLIILAFALKNIMLHIVTNYYIISDITNKQIQLTTITNYSYITEEYTNSNDIDKILSEYYYKDGKGYMESIQKNIIYWYDESIDEEIFINPMDLTASRTKEIIFDHSIPLLLEKEKNLTMEKIKLSIFYNILNGKINEKECYIINCFGSTKYIDLEKGIILKEEVKNDIIEYKEWKFNDVTDEKVSRPELDNTFFDI